MNKVGKSIVALCDRVYTKHMCNVSQFTGPDILLVSYNSPSFYSVYYIPYHSWWWWPHHFRSLYLNSNIIYAHINIHTIITINSYQFIVYIFFSSLLICILTFIYFYIHVSIVSLFARKLLRSKCACNNWLYYKYRKYFFIELKNYVVLSSSHCCYRIINCNLIVYFFFFIVI